MTATNSESVIKMARISYLAVTLFIALLIVLHFVKPELDPSWRFISEYQLGDFGWMMFLAFIAWALSCIALSISLWYQVRNFGGRLGLVLLWVSALGMTIAAIFVTDPLNTPEESFHGKLHQLGATLNMIPFAALLISVNLIRKNELWIHARMLLIWATVLVWIGEITFIVSMVVFFPSGGKFGPDVLVGWPGRAMIAGECIWLIVVARENIKINTKLVIRLNN